MGAPSCRAAIMSGIVAGVALARGRQPRGRLAEEPRHGNVGGTGGDLQEAAHHLGQSAEVDRLARPGLAVAEQQQVVDRLHRGCVHGVVEALHYRT